MKNIKPWVSALLLACAANTRADCIMNAKSATKFQILDNHTILLSGGLSGAILIKSFAFFQVTSQVSVLKDDFCDFESSVLYVDGEVIDAQQVKHIN